jgi:hypothetical protein
MVSRRDISWAFRYFLWVADQVFIAIHARELTVSLSQEALYKVALNLEDPWYIKRIDLAPRYLVWM